eukprot:6185738-Pleurochrysis_carterae.AAC.1
MSTVNMFGALMMLWVVRQVNRGLVVHQQGCGLTLREPQLLEKRTQVNGYFGGLGCSDNLSFAGGQSHSWLLLRRPGNSGRPVHEHPT